VYPREDGAAVELRAASAHDHGQVCGAPHFEVLQALVGLEQ
jgi:hypothetical protein